ncbi:MAG TPA: hypothetical protein VF669_14515 [Tepidisphaeraceae bacterium]|jgi:hypothetical protein
MADQHTPPEQTQKSEVHAATEDAGSSPQNERNLRQDKLNPAAPQAADGLPDHPIEEIQKTFPEGVRVKRDESNVGGPIDIEMDPD